MGTKRNSEFGKTSARDCFSSTRFVPDLLSLEDRVVPATFYIDPVLTGSIDGSTVTFDAGDPDELGGLRYASSAAFFAGDVGANPGATYAFSDLREAINASEINAGPDTVRIARQPAPILLNNTPLNNPVPGGLENSINITQSLSLVGSGTGATVITPTANTQFDDGEGAVDDLLTSIFRVTDKASTGAALNVSNLTFEGAGKLIGFGFSLQDGAPGVFDQVAIRNVVFDPSASSEGIAISAFLGGNLTVSNSSVTGYGRVGIQFVNTSGTVANTTVTGRGAGNFFNSGVDVSGASNVLITGSTITGNLGRVGNSFSDGVLSYADPFDAAKVANVTLIGNTISENAYGIALGLGGAPDGSFLTAQYNNLFGNDIAAFNQPPIVNQIQAPNNYWGDPTGPFNAASNPTGEGDIVSNDVIFTPFLDRPTPLRTAANVADYLTAITLIGSTITPQAGQPNPVLSGPVLFTVTFPQPVTGITPADFAAITTASGVPTVSSVTGTGTTYTVTVTGVTGVGTVSLNLLTRAGLTLDGFLTTASGPATVNFGAPNLAPVVSPITDQTIAVSGTTGPLAFTIGDDRTDPNALGVAVASSNPAFTAVLGGAGANRTVTVTGTPGAVGATTVTLTVTDAEGGSTVRAFTVQTVTNTAPTITPVPDQTIPVGGTAGPLAFTIGDAQDPAANLTVAVTSSNSAFVPTLGGTGANQTVTVVGTPGAVGGTTITLTVTDAQGLSTSTAFTVQTVTNTSPTISPVPDQIIPVGGTAGPLAFTIGDAQTPVADLTVVVTSSNPAFVPTLGGTGADRTVTVVGTPGAVGGTTITLTVTDAQGLSTSTAFTVQTVTNTSPTISPVPDQIIPVGGTAGPLAFTIGDAQSAVNALNVAVTSSNPAFTAVLGGSGSNRTVTVNGAPGAVGATVITLTVTDEQGLSTSTAFSVSTVTNIAPTISSSPDVTIPFNGNTGAVAFTVGDDQTPAGSLAITATSSNPGLLTVTLGGSGANRTVLVSAVPGQSGAATVLLTVTDAQGLATTSAFTVTVQNERTRLFAAGGGQGASPVVQVYERNGVKRFQFVAFELSFTGGVKIATGDLNGDGIDDIVAGAGIGGGPRIRVIDGATGRELANFFAFEESQRNGVNVAIGDIDGDGIQDIIVGAGDGGGPRVSAFTLGGVPIANFFAYESTFRNGVTVAAGDLNGDGTDEIITGAGIGGGPRVSAFNQAGTRLTDFFAYEEDYRGGVNVSSGDLNGDGRSEIITGVGPDGGSRVRAFDFAGTPTIAEFAAFPESPNVLTRVGAEDFDGDGDDEILTGPGPGLPPVIRVFTPQGQQLFQDFAFEPVFTGGIYVG